jgi:hypothetical protein
MANTDLTLETDVVGTEVTRFNALKHGILSRYTVLPWEDGEEYSALVASLIDEHKPQGPTEEHLVEELAGILWRKRRLRLAEAAAYQHGLNDAINPNRGTAGAALAHLDVGSKNDWVVDAIQATAADTADEIRDLETDESMTATALDLIREGKAGSYKRAVSALHADTQEWWEEVLDRDPVDFEEDEEPAMPKADSLRHFLEKEILPWYGCRRKELESRPLIRAQVFGQSLNPDKLLRLSRYEVHLDRKLERILTMLIRLQDIRGSSKNP